MNLVKKINLTLIATPVAKSKNSFLKAAHGLFVSANFEDKSITIESVGNTLAGLLPLRVTCPDEKSLFVIKEETKKKLVLVAKDVFKGLAQEIWTMEDIIEFILKFGCLDEGFSVAQIEFITEQEQPCKPVGCEKKKR